MWPASPSKVAFESPANTSTHLSRFPPPVPKFNQHFTSFWRVCNCSPLPGSLCLVPSVTSWSLSHHPLLAYSHGHYDHLQGFPCCLGPNPHLHSVFTNKPSLPSSVTRAMPPQSPPNSPSELPLLGRSRLPPPGPNPCTPRGSIWRHFLVVTTQGRECSWYLTGSGQRCC